MGVRVKKKRFTEEQIAYALAHPDAVHAECSLPRPNRQLKTSRLGNTAPLPAQRSRTRGE